MDLFRILVAFGINKNACDAILKILRQYTNPAEIWSLPAVFRTAVGRYPNFDIDYTIDESEDEAESDDSDLDNIFDDDDSDDMNPTMTTMTRPKVSNQSNRGVSIYFGIQASLESRAADFNPESTVLHLHINVDGVPIYRSTKKVFWPILGRFHEKEPFEIALYYRRSKPRFSNKFLRKFVAEYRKLENGFSLRRSGRTHRLALTNACFDSPARSFVLNTPNFNAYEGCHKCEVRGVYINHRMCFLDVDAPPRSREQFRSFYLIEGQTKCSELLKIESFNPVRNSQMDSMHIFELVVMRKLLKFWTKQTEFSLPASMKVLLSERLVRARQSCPIEF